VISDGICEKLTGRMLKWRGARYDKGMEGKEISLNGNPHTIGSIKASELKHGHLVYSKG